MKTKLFFSLLLCAIGSSRVYSQTVVGRMKVDQYPTTAAGALTYGLATEFAGLQVPVLVGAAVAVGATFWAVRRLPRMVRALERETPTAR